AIGRWVTRDPYQPDFGDIGNANLYVYCGGDPLNLVDPSGHAGELAGTLGALGILALLSTMVIGTGMSQSLSHVHGVSMNLGIRDDINSLLASGSQALMQAGTLMAANTAVVDKAISRSMA